MEESYYDILQVELNATADEIKKAYFSLVRHYHPDSNTSFETNEDFLELQKAYEILKDPIKRKEYNRLIEQLNPEESYISLKAYLSATEVNVSQDPQLIYALLELESRPPKISTGYSPVHVCFVVDCSTSMKGSRIEMVKDSLIQCIQNLSPRDFVSIVAFNDYAEIIMTPTPIKDVGIVESKIRDIKTGGATELYRGLKEGIDLLWSGNSNTQNKYLVVLTDGHTYGDESKSLDLAEKAREQGIIITTFGIGNDWNDRFLDELASLTGGSSMLISRSEDLNNYLAKLISSLKTIYANNTKLNIHCDNRVKLNYAFRIEPFVAELRKNTPIYIGDLHTDSKTKILLSFQIDQAVKPEEIIQIGSGFIRSELVDNTKQKIRQSYKLSVKIKQHPLQEPPPLDILNAISRINIYQMQEKARNEVQEGSIDEAVKKLEKMASHLVLEGNQSMANVLIREADHLQSKRAFSLDGEKRIKYGTRALLQLPPPAKRKV